MTLSNDPRTWADGTNPLTPPQGGLSAPSLGQVIPGVTGGPSPSPAHPPGWIANDPRTWGSPASPSPSSSGGGGVGDFATTGPPATFPYYNPSSIDSSYGNGKEFGGFSAISAARVPTPADVAKKQQEWIENYVKGQKTAAVTTPETSASIPATPDPNSPPGSTPVLPVTPPPVVSPTTSPTTPDPNAESGTAPASSNPYQQFYVNSLLSTMPEDLGGQVGADGEYYIPNPEVPGGWVKVNPNTGAVT